MTTPSESGSKAAQTLENEIAQFLDEKKALNITVIPLKDRSALADALIIASGTSQRHVSALADMVQRHLKKTYRRKVVVEGDNGSEWILVDSGDVIIHLFSESMRARYNLEEIWQHSFTKTDDA